jgi:hypothetical protein
LVLEGLAFLAAAIATAVIGTPIASTLARPASFRKTEGTGTQSKRSRTDVVRPFEPLDLGPDPVQWPSERPWSLHSTLKSAEWPSKAWDDEHFGRVWRDGSIKELADLGFHAMAARRLNDEGKVIEVPGSKAKKAQPKAQPKPAQQPKAQKQASPAPAKEKGQRRRQPSSVDQEAERKQREIALEQAKTEATFFQEAPKAPAAAPTGVPDNAEIEHLISTVGLAGTVQAIMSRTGWDFREAAQYLARIRQGK